MFGNQNPVHVAQPQPLSAGSEAAGALMLMLCCLWAYSVALWLPTWSFDAKFVVFVAGAVAFVVWVRVFVVLAVLAAVGMLIWARM